MFDCVSTYPDKHIFINSQNNNSIRKDWHSRQQTYTLQVCVQGMTYGSQGLYVSNNVGTYFPRNP